MGAQLRRNQGRPHSSEQSPLSHAGMLAQGRPSVCRGEPRGPRMRLPADFGRLALSSCSWLTCNEPPASLWLVCGVSKQGTQVWLSLAWGAGSLTLSLEFYSDKGGRWSPNIPLCIDNVPTRSYGARRCRDTQHMAVPLRSNNRKGEKHSQYCLEQKKPHWF